MSTETPWAVDRWQGRAIHRCPPLISNVFAKTKHAEQAWNQAVGAKDLWKSRGKVLHDNIFNFFIYLNAHSAEINSSTKVVWTSDNQKSSLYLVNGCTYQVYGEPYGSK